MEIKGIRILDIKDRVLSVEFRDLLKEIENPHEFNWAILSLDVTFNMDVKDSSIQLYDEIEKSKNGVCVTWKELELLYEDVDTESDMIFMANKNKILLKDHKTVKELYERNDITLDLIDCTFWQVFSKNPDLIDRLFKKFKDTQFLTLDNFDKI